MSRPAPDRATLSAVAFLPRAAIVTSTFGGVWFFAGVGAWAGSGWAPLLALAPGLALVFLSVRSMRVSRRVLRELGVDRSELRWSATRRRRYWVVVAVEAVAIVAAALVLPRVGLGWAILPVISLVVGVHFFPLGLLLDNASLHVVGGILTLWSVVVLVAVPPIPAWQSFAAGTGAGVVLLASSARSLIRGALLRRGLADGIRL